LQLLDSVRQLNIELHFSPGLGMESAEDVDKLVATIRLLNSHGFKMWYSFPNGNNFGPHGLTQLYSAGLDEHTCCYEVSFIRTNRQPVKRPLLSNRWWRLRPGYTFPDGKLWHNQGVEFVDEGTFRGNAPYTMGARSGQRARAADMRASEDSCSTSSVSAEAAARLINPTRSTRLNRQCKWHWLMTDDKDVCWTAWVGAIGFRLLEPLREVFY
jgi:hypothetical protein